MSSQKETLSTKYNECNEVKKEESSNLVGEGSEQAPGGTGICNELDSTLVSVIKQLLTQSNDTVLLRSPKDLILFFSPMNPFSSHLSKLSVSFDIVNHSFLLAISPSVFVIQSLSLCSPPTTEVCLVSFGNCLSWTHL